MEGEKEDGKPGFRRHNISDVSTRTPQSDGALHKARSRGDDTSH